VRQNMEAAQGQSPERRRELLARLMQKQTVGQQSVPLSFAQQRLWFLDQLSDAPSLYNMANPLRLRSALDPDVLRRCLTEIVRRHDVLRTTFGTVDGAPVQIVAPPWEVELPIEDLGGIAPEKREDVAERIASEDYNAPFDLRTGPLFRFKLLRLAADDYLLLVTMHHIVSDGWSLSVFFGELSTLYSAYGAGQESPLPELPIQYADFSIWQRKYLEGEVRDQQLSYWKNQLRELTPLDLPADRLRPPSPSFLGARVPVRLEPDASESLRSLCRERNATIFIVLLAALKVLLYRYSGQEDIVVGSPVAGRNRGETESLIGFFINSVVMRTSLAGDPPFREVVDRVRETAIGAYAHQDLPFETLVEELHPERDPGRNPLFQVMFQVLNGADAPANGGGGKSITLKAGTAKFDLSLTLYDSGGRISGFLEFATDLFDRPRIERMVGHYATLIASIAADPREQISTLNLLTPAERRQLLDDWNATSAPFPRDRGILEAFDRNAVERPAAPAVIASSALLSYGELKARSDRLAAQLRARGIAPGAVVAILLPRSPDMIVAALAAFKTGAAYLPIDPEIPAERQNVILAESGAAALISHQVIECPCPIVAPDSVEPGEPAIESPLIAYHEDSPAYVIFTSGSTGKPKGVEVPHRGLTNLIAWHNRTFEVSPASRGSQFASPGFDAAVYEIWPYLAAGASIEIVPDDVRYAPIRIPQWLSDRKITHAFIPPPILGTVVRQPWPAHCSLRFVVTGGDKLVQGVPPGLPFRVFNQYGPTESSVVTTSGPVPEDRGDGAPPSIGRAIDNVELFVVDRNGQFVPVGVPGELWIGGAGLARGYLHAEEQTADCFVAHPLRAGDRVYRSRDIVRYTPDGDLQFLGRLDNQVKIRGFRVELGEIEAVLARLSGVRHACAVLRKDVPGEERLVAYLAGASPDIARIRVEAREKLPAYMVPSDFVVLDSLPLTTNGKIDRARLPEPSRTFDETGCVAPRNKVEAAISAIWCEELRLERVGIDENFFDIGGNSLVLVRVHGWLEKRLKAQISVVELFRYPTIRTLAAFLSERGDQQSVVEKARQRAVRRREQGR